MLTEEQYSAAAVRVRPASCFLLVCGQVKVTSFSMEAAKEIGIVNTKEYTKNGTSTTAMVQLEGRPGGTPQCPDSDSYPTIAEFNETLGGWASALYIVSAVTVVILALQYGFLVGKFNKNVPNQRKV